MRLFLWPLMAGMPEMQEQFPACGEWPVAIAGVNCGGSAGACSRGIEFCSTPGNCCDGRLGPAHRLRNFPRRRPSSADRCSPPLLRCKFFLHPCSRSYHPTQLFLATIQPSGLSMALFSASCPTAGRPLTARTGRPMLTTHCRKQTLRLLRHKSALAPRDLNRCPPCAGSAPAQGVASPPIDLQGSLEVFDLSVRFIFCKTVTLLKLASQVFAGAFGLLEIIVRELAPLCLELACQ